MCSLLDTLSAFRRRREFLLRSTAHGVDVIECKRETHGCWFITWIHINQSYFNHDMIYISLVQPTPSKAMAPRRALLYGSIQRQVCEQHDSTINTISIAMRTATILYSDEVGWSWLLKEARRASMVTISCRCTQSRVVINSLVSWPWSLMAQVHVRVGILT